MENEEIMDELEVITITDQDGNQKEVEVIQYVKLSNDKEYVITTENEADEAGNILMIGSEIVKNGDILELHGIEDEKIVEELTNALRDLLKE